MGDDAYVWIEGGDQESCDTACANSVYGQCRRDAFVARFDEINSQASFDANVRVSGPMTCASTATSSSGAFAPYHRHDNECYWRSSNSEGKCWRK